MSSLSLRDLQGISQYNNKIRIPSGHTLTFDGDMKVPVWTTATRPVAPETGLVGWNTTTDLLEIYDGNTWVGTSGGVLGSSEANPAESAVALVNAGITQNGVYYIKASPSAPTQQVYCILDTAYDGGGWMIIANCPATVYMPNSSHIPRPTAYASYVGSSGSNSYSPGNYFSVNAQDMSFTKFYHVVMNDNTSFDLATKCIGYVGHHLNVSRSIPPTQYWAIDAVGTSMTRGNLVNWPGFGNKRCRQLSSNYLQNGSTVGASGRWGFGCIPIGNGSGGISGSNQATAIGTSNNYWTYGSSAVYTPTYIAWWDYSSYMYTSMSFTDAYGTTVGAAQQCFGADDWQDGSGSSNNWNFENTPQSTALGKPSLIMIK